MNIPVYSEKPRLPIARRRSLPVLLLDVSASMALGIPRRIDVLWQAVQVLRMPHATWKAALFSNHCEWSTLEHRPEPDGNTNLSGAFDRIGQVAVTSATLVTDGEPNDAAAAHARDLALGCPISVLYVGDVSNAEAIAFCQRLCLATGGTFATEALTLTATPKVTATLQRMLGTGAPPKAAIVLGEPT